MHVRRAAAAERRAGSRATRPRARARRARRRRRARGGARPRRPRAGGGRACGPRCWSRPGRCPCERSVEPERADARQALGAALADRGGDRPWPPRACAVDLDVERDQRRPGGDEHRAGGRVQPRAGRRRAPARRRDALGQPLRAAAAQLGAGAPAGELAVEEHRAGRARARARRRGAAPRRTAAPRSAASRYTIGATSTAPTRGCTPACARQVDPLDRLARAREHALVPAPRARRPA